MSGRKRKDDGLNSLFSGARPSAERSRSGGRPKDPDPQSAGRRRKRMRSTNVLDVEVLIWLDQESTEIKKRTGGKSVRRSEMMRAILAAVRDAGVDLGCYRSEEEMRDALVERLTETDRKGEGGGKS